MMLFSISHCFGTKIAFASEVVEACYNTLLPLSDMTCIRF